MESVNHWRRVWINLSPAEAMALEDYQFSCRIRTRSETIRVMIRLAVNAQKPKEEGRKDDG